MLERLLLVGFGSIGRRHARLVRMLVPAVRIVVLRRNGAPVIADPVVERFVTTLADALAFKPQAAVVANPASHHLAVSLALVEASVPVLIEKPIADASPGVAELLTAAQLRGVTVMTAYNLRFVPSLVRFRELVQSQSVGRVLSVRAEVGQYLPGWRPGTDYRCSVSARRDLGGGVLLELSHELDYLRWIFGEVEWVQATVTRQSRMEIDVEDTAHLTLGFAKTGAGAPLVAALNLDFIRHDTTRVCTVIGEEGSLRWNGISGAVELFEAGGKDWREIFQHSPQRDESYIAEWMHFLGCTRTQTRPLVSGEDGLAALTLVEAAREASQSGMRVHIGKATVRPMHFE